MIIAVCLLCLAAISADHANEIPKETVPIYTYTMDYFPKTVALGDSIYIRIQVTNTGNAAGKTAKQLYNPVWNITSSVSSESLDIFPEVSSYVIGRGYPISFPLQLNETRTLLSRAITIPPLEDWESTFVKSLKQQTSPGNIACKITCTPIFKKWFFSCYPDFPVLSGTINIISRPEIELQMIQKWYHSTPQNIFPSYYDEEHIKVTRNIFPPARVRCAQIHNTMYPLWKFIPIGNRYPGDPNCPETWQGWKELEESLTPSTMRDEIRMTRIVIQYCDTEDSKVLDELTEWLQNMNAIQRVVMVQNVMNLPNLFLHDGKVHKSLLQLIETIKPFSAEELPAEIPAETGK